MKEASYNAMMSSTLAHTYGGKVLKLADRATLGLPDTIHYKDSVMTWLEVKIGKPSSVLHQKNYREWFCRPSDCVNDLRQYEHCRAIGKSANLIWVIYWPHIRMTSVVTQDMMELFWRTKYLLKEGRNFTSGHGIQLIINILEQKRKELYVKLQEEYRAKTP
jgi:hypothetical protein